MSEEIYQHKLQLEEAGVEPAQVELIGENLSKEEAKQEISDENLVGVEAAAEWQAKTMRDEENNTRVRCDLPIHKEEVQQASLQKKSQPME
jgi:hypothetical protein